MLILIIRLLSRVFLIEYVKLHSDCPFILSFQGLSDTQPNCCFYEYKNECRSILCTCVCKRVTPIRPLISRSLTCSQFMCHHVFAVYHCHYCCTVCVLCVCFAFLVKRTEYFNLSMKSLEYREVLALISTSLSCNVNNYISENIIVHKSQLYFVCLAY